MKMALLSRSFAIPRIILRRSFITAYIAASSRNRPLSYVIGSLEMNPASPIAFSKCSRCICTYDTRCCKSINLRAAHNTALNSELASNYLRETRKYSKLQLSIKRTMCTIKKDDKICWNCKKEIGKEIFFCEICKIIQPPLTELSFFEIFGCPEEYTLNVKHLTDRYRELQSMIHPDKFSNSDEQEKHYSAEQSSLINKAYNTLLDPLSRADYLLRIKNIEIGESNTVEGQEFLLEVMEINERLNEVKSMDELDDIRSSNNDSIDCCIENLTKEFENGNLEAAKDLTIRLRYYRNILEIIKEKTMELDI